MTRTWWDPPALRVRPTYGASGRDVSANALNYLLYQAGWCATIGAVLAGLPAAGMAIAAALTGVHVWLARAPREELRLVVIGGTIGLVIDSAQVAAGLIAFPSGGMAAWLCPPWIVVLWMQVATTFRYSLRRFVSRPLGAAVSGAIGGPLAYVGGEGLGLVFLREPRTITLAVMGVLWAAALLMVARGVGGSAPGEYRRPLAATGARDRGTTQPKAASEQR